MPFCQFSPRQDWNEGQKHSLTQSVFLPVLLLLCILNQIAIQIFHIAIAERSITVEEEQRKCLEIRKLNNFCSYTCWWKSWPQTGDCPAASHPRWEIASEGATKSLLLCCFSSVLLHVISSLNLSGCSTFVLKLTGAV